MNTKATTQPKGINLNKPAYIIFVLTGIGFIIAKDLPQAVIFWGLALVFDPFNVNMAFDKRPFYQKLWLIVHLAIASGLFILMLLS